MSHYDELHPRSVLSSYGRLFMYSAAQSLVDHSSLDRLYTADLRSPPHRVRSFTTRFPRAMSALTYGLGRYRLWPAAIKRIWIEYDKWVSRHLGVCHDRGANIFHGWSLFCLASLQQAKAAGMVCILDRSCPHISTQRQILEEEISLLGIRESFDANAYFQQAPRMMAEYNEADYVLTCSEYSRRSFVDHGFDSERVISIPLGANFPPHRIGRIETMPFRVFCVGTHPYRKGVVYLIRAWQKANLPDAQLVLRAPVVPQTAAMIDDPSITILPPVSRAQLVEEYQRATVFCLPSIDDGFGMVALEAMAFGLPVIVSTHVGASEILQPGVDGLIFPVRDVDALAECLVTMYHDRERTLSMGENALARSQEYTWDRYGDRLVQFYKSALAQQGER